MRLVEVKGRRIGVKTILEISIKKCARATLDSRGVTAGGYMLVLAPDNPKICDPHCVLMRRFNVENGRNFRQWLC